MNESNLDKLTGAGFKKIGASLVGKIDGYFFTVTDRIDAENETDISINLAQNDERSKFLEFLDKEEHFKEYSIDKNNISITFKEDAGKDIVDALNDAAAKLSDIGALCICGSCDSTDNLGVYSNGTLHSILCDKCGEGVLKTFDEEKNRKGNYVKGFFASLIGALLGSLLWILIGMAGFYASIAGLAISFCAFKGYEMAGAKVSKTGVIINVITILIAFLFAQHVGLYIELHKEIPELTFSMFILNTHLILSDSDVLRYVLPNMGLGFLFVALGAYRTIANNFDAAKQAAGFKIEKVEL